MTSLLRILISAVLALFAIALAAPASWAHDQLASSSPSSGQALTQAPSQIVLTFEEAPMEGTAAVTATDSSGKSVEIGLPSVSDNVVKVAWPANTPAGSYTVNWRVVSDDGHPVSGQIPFSYTSAAATTAAATPTATSTPSTSSDSSMPVLIPALGAAALVLAGIIGLLIRRRSSQDS